MRLGNQVGSRTFAVGLRSCFHRILPTQYRSLSAIRFDMPQRLFFEIL